jgi:hypothetical protein
MIKMGTALHRRQSTCHITLRGMHEATANQEEHSSSHTVRMHTPAQPDALLADNAIGVRQHDDGSALSCYGPADGADGGHGPGIAHASAPLGATHGPAERYCGSSGTLPPYMMGRCSSGTNFLSSSW